MVVRIAESGAAIRKDDDAARAGPLVRRRTLRASFLAGEASDIRFTPASYRPIRIRFSVPATRMTSPHTRAAMISLRVCTPTTLGAWRRTPGVG